MPCDLGLQWRLRLILKSLLKTRFPTIRHRKKANPDMNVTESCELQKIIPSSSLESSYDSSPRLHKQASGQLESTGLPNNTRSIQNRDMKANIVKKDCGEN